MRPLRSRRRPESGGRAVIGRWRDREMDAWKRRAQVHPRRHRDLDTDVAPATTGYRVELVRWTFAVLGCAKNFAPVLCAAPELTSPFESNSPWRLSKARAVSGAAVMSRA